MGMPAASAANKWEKAKTMYLQGHTLPEIATVLQCSYAAMRAACYRGGWPKLVEEAGQAAQQAMTKSLAERGKSWGHRIADLVEKRLTHLEGMDPKKLKLQDLSTMTQITETVDKIARRTFGLDEAPVREPLISIEALHSVILLSPELPDTASQIEVSSTPPALLPSSIAGEAA